MQVDDKISNEKSQSLDGPREPSAQQTSDGTRRHQNLNKQRTAIHRQGTSIHNKVETPPSQFLTDSGSVLARMVRTLPTCVWRIINY